MSENNTKGRGLLSKGLVFLLVNIVLGFFLTLGSILYQRHPDPACHGGGLSAGFPLPFICDDSAGSPISSWGKIDLVDIFSINPRVFLLDFLLYNALVSTIWAFAAGILRKGLSQVDTFRWAIFLCIANIVIFLFAFLSFQSGNLDFSVPFPRTPTPIFFTPTPFGTPPLPSVAPT